MGVLIQQVDIIPKGWGCFLGVDPTFHLFSMSVHYRLFLFLHFMLSAFSFQIRSFNVHLMLHLMSVH